MRSKVRIELDAIHVKKQCVKLVRVVQGNNVVCIVLQVKRMKNIDVEQEATTVVQRKQEAGS